MSRVTVVPAATAAVRIARALASASFSSNFCPSALSFRLTSAAGVSELAQQPQVFLFGVFGLVCVECVLAQIIQRHLETAANQFFGHAQSVGGAGPGDEPPHDTAADRGGFN